jgi:cytochrome c oxidase assembly protein subunit 11
VGKSARQQYAPGSRPWWRGFGVVFDRDMEISSSLMASAVLTKDQENKRLAYRLALVALVFAGFGFGMVPLYDVICKLTGVNGRTNVMAVAADKNTQVDTSRWVNVEFLSHSMPGVGLAFAPEQFTMRVHPGAIVHINYVVKNETTQVFVGQAIPSVTPASAAMHFQKIECFCFTQQTFQPGEVRTMPVVFVINPELNRDLGTVTLSYTFFEAVKAGV